MEKQAFVLFTCKPEEENETKSFLNKIPQIKNSSIVKGAYDIVVKVKSSSREDLRGMLVKIRQLPTVRSTLTLQIHG